MSKNKTILRSFLIFLSLIMFGVMTTVILEFIQRFLAKTK